MASAPLVGFHSSFMIGTLQSSLEDSGIKYLKDYYYSLVHKRTLTLFLNRVLWVDWHITLQIFQWLASMPVELEGYIRPGCTILTVFVAMPTFKWGKVMWLLPLSGDNQFCV